MAALYILLLQYVCNKKNINVRLPFCVEASQKTNFERKFNNWNFEATINISRTEIRSFLQKSVILLKREKKCKNCCYLIIKKQNLPMDKNCFSHHKNWVQKIKNQNSSNTPKVNNNQDFLKKKFVSLFLFSLGKKIIICFFYLYLSFNSSLPIIYFIFKTDENFKRITTLWNHTGCYYINEFKVFFYKKYPPFCPKKYPPCPLPITTYY